MSHCGPRSFMIILITAALSSNTYNQASWCENRTLEGTHSILFNTLVFPWDLWLLSMITGRPGPSVVRVMFLKTETNRSHKSRARIPSNLNPASKERWFRNLFNWNWSLFLTHPTYWNKCMTSKNAQCFARSRFWVPKIFSKIGVLKQFQSALFCSITHIAIPLRPKVLQK